MAKLTLIEGDAGRDPDDEITEEIIMKPQPKKAPPSEGSGNITSETKPGRPDEPMEPREPSVILSPEIALEQMIDRQSREIGALQDDETEKGKERMYREALDKDFLQGLRDSLEKGGRAAVTAELDRKEAELDDVVKRLDRRLQGAAVGSIEDIIEQRKKIAAEKDAAEMKLIRIKKIRRDLSL